MIKIKYFLYTVSVLFTVSVFVITSASTVYASGYDNYSYDSSITPISNLGGYDNYSYNSSVTPVSDLSSYDNYSYNSPITPVSDLSSYDNYSYNSPITPVSNLGSYDNYSYDSSITPISNLGGYDNYSYNSPITPVSDLSSYDNYSYNSPITPISNLGGYDNYSYNSPITPVDNFTKDYIAAVGTVQPYVAASGYVNPNNNHPSSYKNTYTATSIPTIKIVQKPSSSYSNFELDYYNATHNYPVYHNPIHTTTTGGNGTTVINNNNTNTNTNTVNVPQQPQSQPIVYNNYQPPVQYVNPIPPTYIYNQAPAVTAIQTAYTPAYDYIRVNQVPYTGTNDVVYVLTLIAVVLASIAGVIYFKGGLVSAFAGVYGDTSTTLNEDKDGDGEKSEDNTEVVNGNTTLSVIEGEDGPKLSFHS